MSAAGGKASFESATDEEWAERSRAGGTARFDSATGEEWATMSSAGGKASKGKGGAYNIGTRESRGLPPMKRGKDNGYPRHIHLETKTNKYIFKKPGFKKASRNTVHECMLVANSQAAVYTSEELEDNEYR